MTFRLLVLIALSSLTVDTPLMVAQERRIPERRSSTDVDVSGYAQSTFMRMLMTGDLDELDRIGPSNPERSRIRGYLFGMFEVMAPFASSSSATNPSRAAEPCAEVSDAFADHHEYLKGWLRDHVKLLQVKVLQSATQRGALAVRGVMGAPGEFGDMQDIVQDGRTDGGRLVRALAGCHAPVFKAIVTTTAHLRRNLPSSADPYVARMPGASDLQAVTGYYAIRGASAITGVTVAAVGAQLTMTDSRGRTYGLRPVGDHVFLIEGSGEDRVTFHPQRQAIVFGLGSAQFMGTRADTPVGFESPTVRYQVLAGQYRVITSPSLKRQRTVASFRDAVLTVSVADGNLILTDAAGRQHQLQPTGPDAFVIPGAEVTIRFVVGPRVITLQYREGVQGFSATLPQSGGSRRR